MTPSNGVVSIMISNDVLSLKIEENEPVKANLRVFTQPLLAIFKLHYLQKSSDSSKSHFV
jgi:hypothetical protein